MKSVFYVTAILLAAGGRLPAASSPVAESSPAAWDPAFFQHCAFVSVDVQESGPRTHITE